jgi:hypothetical protein
VILFRCDLVKRFFENDVPIGRYLWLTRTGILHRQKQKLKNLIFAHTFFLNLETRCNAVNFQNKLFNTLLFSVIVTTHYIDKAPSTVLSKQAVFIRTFRDALCKTLLYSMAK